jgi:alkylation response protein AidB-like acyl-CoA dehydrogenase
VDLTWTPQELSFRDEVRSFLDEHLPASWTVLRLDHDLEQGEEAIRRAWQRILFDHGWLKLTWGADEGGRGATRMMEAIFQAELVERGAPPIWGRAGSYLLAPTLHRHSTALQKARFIEPTLAGDVFFCQAFSEPDSGSDLASLRTSATRVDGGWRLNGQKCWSSGAMYADRAFLLARTDPTAVRHHGIGFFLVDMKQPGIEVRETKQASGHSEFGEIFLSDAFVADDDVVDEPTNGWNVAMTTFAFERAAMANAMLLQRAIREVANRMKSTGMANDPIARQRLARLVADARVFSWLSFLDLSRYENGEVPGAETSLSKMGWSETQKRLRSFAVDLNGMHSTGRIEDGSTEDPFLHLWIWSAAQTIYGGTSEIQRNIVAERILGLPRN